MNRSLRSLRRHKPATGAALHEGRLALHGHLDALLAELHAELVVQRTDGAAREQRVAAEITALRAELGAVRTELATLLDGQAETRTRVRRTQALTARAYEAAQGWPALLATARAAPEYERAYAEADPLVSIPIPTYRSPETLCERALASVRAQTHERWEAIVVGDHCTDETEERVRALGDERIRFVNLPVREHDPTDPWEAWAVRGSVPRSRGIELARGSWIAPLSHDDAWDPDHLVTLLGAARERRAEVAYSRQRVLDAEAPGHPVLRTIGAFPPRLGDFNWQAAIFHGALRFLRYDRACALASEPNDWNLARRAWEAGVSFHHVERETMSLFLHDRSGPMLAALAAQGLPAAALAFP